MSALMEKEFVGSVCVNPPSDRASALPDDRLISREELASLCATLAMKSNRPVLVEHDTSKEIGMVTSMFQAPDTGTTYARFKLFETEQGRSARDLIERGDMRGLSLGTNWERIPGQTTRRVDLRELSLCKDGYRKDTGVMNASKEAAGQNLTFSALPPVNQPSPNMDNQQVPQQQQPQQVGVPMQQMQQQQAPPVPQSGAMNASAQINGHTLLPFHTYQTGSMQQAAPITTTNGALMGNPQQFLKGMGMGLGPQGFDLNTLVQQAQQAAIPSATYYPPVQYNPMTGQPMLPQYMAQPQYYPPQQQQQQQPQFFPPQPQQQQQFYQPQQQQQQQQAPQQQQQQPVPPQQAAPQAAAPPVAAPVPPVSLGRKRTRARVQDEDEEADEKSATPSMETDERSSNNQPAEKKLQTEARPTLVPPPVLFKDLDAVVKGITGTQGMANADKAAFVRTLTEAMKVMRSSFEEKQQVVAARLDQVQKMLGGTGNATLKRLRDESADPSKFESVINELNEMAALVAQTQNTSINPLDSKGLAAPADGLQSAMDMWKSQGNTFPSHPAQHTPQMAGSFNASASSNSSTAPAFPVPRHDANPHGIKWLNGADYAPVFTTGSDRHLFSKDIVVVDKLGTIKFNK